MTLESRRNTYRIPMIISLCLLIVFLARFLYTEYHDKLDLLDIRDKEEAYIAALEAIEKRIGTKHLDSIEHAIAVAPLDIDSLFISSPGEDFNISIIKDSAGLDVERIIILEGDGSSRDLFSFEEAEISPLKVLSHILPQILFSLVLLGSVLLTFWMIQRNLRRERRYTDMRNNLMSNMSHELKTPVTTIGVALEALQSFDAANDAAMRKEYLEISKQEVNRLNLLIDKTINISLFEAGKFRLEKNHIDLKQEIEHILSIMHLQFQNQAAKVSTTYSGTDFQLMADKTHLTNVIYNLLENALKYTQDTPEIIIHVEAKNDDIRLTISDNGVGIPPQYRSRIFDKLFRVPTGNEHNVKGHGLGLSYVREVVLNHRGRIQAIDSALGGVSFEIILPKNQTHD